MRRLTFDEWRRAMAKRGREEDSEQPGGYGLEEVERILRDSPATESAVIGTSEDADEGQETGSFESGGGESGGAGSSGDVQTEGESSGDE
jgi:uncharacterized membrane protein YgcG